MAATDKLKNTVSAVGSALKTAAANKAASESKSSNSKKNNTNTGSNNYTKNSDGSVTTNTSWKGDYLTVDLNTDYKSLMDAAANSGNYAQAANYEALRNAKINYLNSINGTNNSTTSEYIKDYGYSNNKGGITYTSNKTMNDLTTGKAGTYNINGATYKKDDNGNYYLKTGANSSGAIFNKIGDGYNTATGEFTFSNLNDAKNAYLWQSGVRGTNYQIDNAKKDYLKSIGMLNDNYAINNEYVNALMNGTTGEYTNKLLASVKEKQKEGLHKQQAALNINGQSDTLMQTAKNLAEPEAVIQDVNENSFENDSAYYQALSNRYAQSAYRRQ